MSYLDICIFGWNLNALMFVVNFLIAIRTISSEDKTKFVEESLVLEELKQEFQKYYPYKAQETLLTYLFPFAAFFKMSFRFVEMIFFFKKNQQARMFDYMVYKYTSQIKRAKNR